MANGNGSCSRAARRADQLGHDQQPDAKPRGHRRPAWFPVVLSRLGRRANIRAPCGHGGRVGPQGLNHVEAAYFRSFRSDLLDERRQLMQRWADYVSHRCQTLAPVVPSGMVTDPHA